MQNRTRLLSGQARRVLFVSVLVTVMLFLWLTDSPRASKPTSLSPLSPFSGHTPRYSPYYGGVSTRPIDLSSDPLPPNATLSERLGAWERAPGATPDVTMAHYARWNAEQCGANIHNQQHWYMLDTFGGQWAAYDMDAVLRIRSELIGYMRGVEVEGEVARAHELRGRAIVMLAGGEGLRLVLWTVAMLRSYWCNLPIYIYHFESETPAAGDPLRLRLEAHNAILVPVSGVPKAPTGKSYHLKAHAIAAAPFRHILYLDSDSTPTRNPEYMFDAPSYTRLGAYLTPDYFKTPGPNPLWAVAGLKCRNEWEAESGQLLLDKARHADVLALARYMLTQHAKYFTFSDGDKDMLRWSLLMLRKRWAVPGRYVAAAGFPEDTATGFCAHSMVQHDAWGSPFTVHWNLLKKHHRASVRGHTWGRSVRMPLFDAPPTPATARLKGGADGLGEGGADGRGDVDCDMLADADEEGYARAPAHDDVMRRAIREQGVHSYWHGGVGTPFCLGLAYSDIRPAWRQEAAADEAAREADEVQPDWSSPLEVVDWADDAHLKDFEENLYTRFGFDLSY
ncbi:hypothetical protein CspeluHIS016_0900460 [Cutaneotrichosporon spelunceum]|uniref:Nucleotide-diphospho-sugar transferase n=1 Tax=Cutaneotrichosporon spelunceum TaxID=1672016 RepID=A0AAD3YF84_9TREE|nr:hypothetical protein CspeluHIS016_0900460 [Cutaneotrichosporon spelunceum]